MKPNGVHVALVIAGGLVGAGAQMVWQRSHEAIIQQRIDAAETRAATAETESQRLQKTLAAEQAEATAKTQADAERREKKRQANAVAKQIAHATEVAGPKPVSGSVDAWVANASDPAVMRRMAEQARLQVNRRYEPLFEQLKLSGKQKDELVKLLVDKRQVAADVAAASFQRGADPREDPATYLDLIAATRDNIENQIHDLLGDDGYQGYQNFDRGIGRSQVVNQLTQLLADSRQPLTPLQATQLEATMAANKAQHISAKVVKDAATFLSAEQLQTLRDLRAIQQANSRKRNAPVPVLPTTPAGR